MENQFTITQLNRESLPLKIYIRGLSGSGKTYGALTLARGICPDGKIGVIDALGGQANQYGGYPEFGNVSCIGLSSPYTADRCIAAIEAATKDGWEVIIFDGLSSHHDGEGGQLDRASEEESKGVKGMGKWNKPKMETRRLMGCILGSTVHFIGTYIMAETTDMDTKTSKISPIQTKGSDSYYTFHVEVKNIIDKEGEYHPATWLRLPKNYQDCIVQGAEITAETGRMLAHESGSATVKPTPTGPDEHREKHIQDIATFLDSEDLDVAHFNAAIEATYKGKFRDFEKLPTDHLAKLSKSDALTKMAIKARELNKKGEA